MENLIQLVDKVFAQARLSALDRERCQMVYPVTQGSCYSERCAKKTEFACSACRLALCLDCVEVVAFDPYCQACAYEQRKFIAVLIEGLRS